MARRRFPVVSTSVVAFAGINEWYEPQRVEPVKATAAPVPVTVAIASRQHHPIYLTGLGAVQASVTVGTGLRRHRRPRTAASGRRQGHDAHGGAPANAPGSARRPTSSIRLNTLYPSWRHP